MLAGSKTATCWAAAHAGPATAHTRSIILDGAGRSAVVVETLSCKSVRFCDVDDAFAADEGEGDLSLAHWRDAHRRYFTRHGVFADDMMLWCERFRLVERL
ncbi:ASCH domain-containing protein [Sandarakinorhabdus sp.]|uniref:ASCH domain-containing protein n=1 Tax=Sandarakinorhabdus sp. TaxID=1916663 RepID=UPI00333F9856